MKTISRWKWALVKMGVPLWMGYAIVSVVTIAIGLSFGVAWAALAATIGLAAVQIALPKFSRLLQISEGFDFTVQVNGHWRFLALTSSFADDFRVTVVKAIGTQDPLPVPWTVSWRDSPEQAWRRATPATSELLNLAECLPTGEMSNMVLFRFHSPSSPEGIDAYVEGDQIALTLVAESREIGTRECRCVQLEPTGEFEMVDCNG